MIRLPLGNILLPILLSLLAPHNHGQLSLPSPAFPELPEGVNAADLRMPGVSPQMNESYLCSAFPLNSDRDHFIVGFEPVPTSHHIHHMIVYGCELPGSGDEAWDCGEMASSRGRYSHSPVCSSQPDIIYAWAHDAPELILPEGVGFRVGGSSTAQFLVLQVHYMRAAKDDTSGIRIIHTEHPQPREASTLLLATDGRIAPTKNEQLEVACVVDEPAVLHPFAFRVHTHRHGRKVAGWTVQEDPISGKDRWTMLGQRDPQLPQLFQPVANQSIIISQGDVLAARCTMENGEKREIKIGPTGEDEMCNFYLMYWTENGQNLEQNACFSPGPPVYRWTKNAGLNHTPKRK
uniref:peptidylglycine monooxygenase n=1 Tax=Globodera rostochiensis TaxID=31243 RepID=A0A914GT51_GLORO